MDHVSVLAAQCVALHRASAATAHLAPTDGAWGRVLDWWLHAARLAPALPLGLVADLGALLAGASPPVPVTADPSVTFLHAVAATPAVRTARLLGLSDLAITALLAYVAQGVVVAPAFHLPATLTPHSIRSALLAALAQPSVTPMPAEAFPADAVLANLLARLQQLRADDIRFLHAFGLEPLNATELAELHALTALLSLPPLMHTLLSEVLAFLPALAEAPAGVGLQTYAVDGYGGIARHGSLDAVLPSEWALPSALLTYRMLNGELLYYGHERPPERRPPLLLLLVQGGDAMAGDPQVLVQASALALARAARLRGAVVRVALVDSQLHPPQGIEHPTEVLAFIHQSSIGGIDLPRVLGGVQTYLHTQTPNFLHCELMWLLHAHAGADDPLGAVRSLAQRLQPLAGSRALFVATGERVERPVLAGIIAEAWTSIGSAALYQAEARTQAAAALRGLVGKAQTEWAPSLRKEPQN